MLNIMDAEGVKGAGRGGSVVKLTMDEGMGIERLRYITGKGQLPPTALSFYQLAPVLGVIS